MISSGKGLIGVWQLHRTAQADQWAVKDEARKKSWSPSLVASQDSCVIFSLKNSIGSLARVLKIFQDHGINVVHIESRRSRKFDDVFEILLEAECTPKELKSLSDDLQHELEAINTCSSVHGNPRLRRELSRTLTTAESFGGYRRTGQPIPRIQYTEQEVKTWGVIFGELRKLYPKYACAEYNQNWPLLEKFCGYRQDNIPQLEDINIFLKRKTGFSVRPVAGYLSPRDFLAGLAFRVFHCTQYIRHPSDPFYTPEPDCCHELLGHMPLLANPSFAQFSQELGLASLGAGDSDVKKLATLYFFTVEFGLCKDQRTGDLRVYGAGLLSSIAELKHAISPKAEVKPFVPEEVCDEECLITTFQNRYFYTDSFEEAKEKLRSFAESIQRPFGIRFNPYTQSVEVLTSSEKIASVIDELRGDLCIVNHALKKISNGEDCKEYESALNELNQHMERFNTDQ
ncbi:unnamed protein product [Cyprideis torosa]|uniref:Tryptophan 5-hydroxylase 2 n=1 Tax=Cyprideis torosa TaxID=163714 RepID=A0A7R8ZIM9_9CRUS|nr:unnamed protein product [Cyprideis torosa]CAG0886544.1 unnamed protein product [Cyprideis torosa]